MDEYFARIDAKIDRIEEKMNYLLAMVEELFAEYDDKDSADDDLEEDCGNEGWISGLDSWKEDYDED